MRSWRVWLRGVALATLASLGAVSAQATEFYFFINGDNDLIGLDERGRAVSQAERTLAVVEKAAQDAGDLASFHIYIDPSSRLSGAGAQTRLIRYDGGRKVSDDRLGETDSTDPQWLDRLLEKSFKPGTARVLSLWGHGDTWLPVERYDHSVPAQSMQYLALAAQLAGHRVDFLIFDACKMGAVEVLSAFSTHVNTIVASQFDLPVDGVFYGGLPSFLRTERGQDPGPLRRFWAQRLYDHLRKATRQRMRDEGKEYIPLVQYDLTQFEFFRDEFNRTLAAFHQMLGQMPEADWRAIWNEIVVKGTKTERQVDIRAFAHFAKKLLGLDTEPLLKAFERGLYPQVDPQRNSTGYGSAGFFMPHDYGLQNDAHTHKVALVAAKETWTLKLENWNWVRQWLIPTKGAIQ